MPTKVYFVEVNDEVAPLTRLLFNLHFGVIVISVISAFLDLLEHFLKQAALEKFEESGIEAGQSDSLQDGAFVLAVGFFLVFPPLLLAWLNYSVKGNNRQSMQLLCFFDGYCVYCTMVGAFFALLAVLSNRWMNTYLTEEAECRPNGYWDGSQLRTYSSGTTQATCEDTLAAVEETNNIAFPFSILTVIVTCIDLALCGLLTAKTGEATNLLGQGKYFVGVPPPPSPNMNMVVGQVVGQPVAGQPQSELQGSGNVITTGAPVQTNAQSQPGGKC